MNSRGIAAAERIDDIRILLEGDCAEKMRALAPNSNDAKPIT